LGFASWGVKKAFTGGQDPGIEETNMLLIEYPKCSTCQKAKKWLQERKVTFETRHIVEQNPSVEELREWIARSGLPLKRFFNTSGMKYRELELSKKLPDMSEEEQLKLLASDGMLVKRPLLVAERGIYPGFREKEWEAILDE
jgi:arsenate reductase